ncbi:collagen alpha-1(I) chain-like [Candoia aspera]|uniref:collagen alpha-1(I) chain-like n=1 Tax=Candoia aspera TaxID=51853 RepID=UPI002FD82C3B
MRPRGQRGKGGARLRSEEPPLQEPPAHQGPLPRRGFVSRGPFRLAQVLQGFPERPMGPVAAPREGQGTGHTGGREKAAPRRKPASHRTRRGSAIPGHVPGGPSPGSPPPQTRPPTLPPTHPGEAGERGVQGRPGLLRKAVSGGPESLRRSRRSVKCHEPLKRPPRRYPGNGEGRRPCWPTCPGREGARREPLSQTGARALLLPPLLRFLSKAALEGEVKETPRARRGPGPRNDGGAAPVGAGENLPLSCCRLSLGAPPGDMRY